MHVSLKLKTALAYIPLDFCGLAFQKNPLPPASALWS